MMRSLLTAKSGMISQQRALDTHANNIANVNTTGFKAKQVSFADALYSSMETNNQGQITVGNGVIPARTYTDTTSGHLQQTDGAFDFAINGSGYFKLISPNGEVYYTRDGNFKLSPRQNGVFLVSNDGYYVTDAASNPIDVSNGQDILSRIGIFAFDNEEQLLNVGHNRLSQTEGSGAARTVHGTVVQSSLESSNVDIAAEMTQIILTQRAFQFNARVAQLSDEIEQTANNLPNP